MDAAKIRMARCTPCGRETKHIPIFCHSLPSQGNGDTAAEIIVESLFCLECWTRREPDATQ